MSRSTLCLLYLYLVWGSSYLANHYVLESLPPLLMGGLRFSLAGLLLLFLSRHQPRPGRAALGSALLTGALLLGLGSGGVIYAQQEVDSGLAAISVASVGLWTTVFSAGLGQRIDAREWLGVVVGLGGVGLLFADQRLQASPVGALCLLVGALGWGLGTSLMRRLPMPVGLGAPGYQMMTGGVLLLLVGWLRGEELTGTPSLRSVLAFLYLLVAASLLAFVAFTYLVGRVRPALATSYAYVNPVLALALGHWFAAEPFSVESLWGLGLILTALVLIAWRRP